MCTVTFIARKNGYALGMNRDEKLTRVQALPPARHELNGRAALFPSEPGGGTWIGVNEAGVTFALINWYSVPARVPANAVSRGLAVRSALGFNAASQLDKDFEDFPLDRTNPFRLIGVFPHDEGVIEWRWDLRRLGRVEHEWKTNIWISSGFDEPGAERTRRETFHSATRSQRDQNLQWLRKLHGSHAPTPGSYSVCMHRADAATVSYTEIAVSDSKARLAYSPSQPCCSAACEHQTLELLLARRFTDGNSASAFSRSHSAPVA
jgi:hypothetical protein